jgi:hypothetical protein
MGKSDFIRLFVPCQQRVLASREEWFWIEMRVLPIIQKLYQLIFNCNASLISFIPVRYIVKLSFLSLGLIAPLLNVLLVEEVGLLL